MVNSISSCSIGRAMEEIGAFVMQRHCLVCREARNTAGLLNGHIGSVRSSYCLIVADSLLLVVQLQSRQLIDMVNTIDIVTVPVVELVVAVVIQ